MSRQSNKEKRENEELDLILAKIQQTFDNDDLDDVDSDSSESNDNAEFSEMLKQLIQDAETKSDTESVESSTDNESEEEFAYANFINDEFANDNEPSASEETNVDEEIIDAPSEAEVDSVLQLMFSRSESKSEPEPITSERDETVEEMVEEIAEELVESITNEPALEPYIDLNNSNVEEDVSSNLESEITATPDSPLSYFDDESEEADDQMENDDTLEQTLTQTDSEEVYAPVHSEISFEENNEIESPRIILSPSEYTYDPLQNGLPDFTPDCVFIDCDADTLENANDDSNKFTEPQEEQNDHLDTNDISLLLNFGYGEEIKSRVSEDETHKIINEKYNGFSPESHRIPHGFCGKEITNKKESKQIREKFKSDKSIIIIQLTLMAILMITTLLLEGFFEFFSDRSSYLAISAIEMVFVVITVAILNKKIISGLLGIIKFEANLYSIAAYLLFAYSICNIATSLVYAIDDSLINASGLMLFGFCTMLYILFILVAELLNCIREAETFKIMATSGVIRTAEPYTAPKDKKSSSKVVSKGDYRSYRLVKTSLISGYFQKSANSVIADVNLIYVIGIVPILSLVAGTISTVISENILNGMYSMMITTFLCIPFAYVLDPSVIEYVTSVFLKKDKIALIGYDAAIELSKINSLCFDDTDAIEVISFTEIHPTKSTDTNKNIDLARRVFEALGGPLGELSNRTDRSDNNFNARGDIIINSISDNGLAIYFDSSINILLGDKNYMQAHNIKVKTDSNLSTAIKGFDRSVIYMAFDGIPKLGFIITSKVKPEFANIVSLLIKHNIEILVDTYEPQINDLYFEQSKADAVSSVSVLKSEKYELTDYKSVCDGQIICASDSFSLAKAIVQCKAIVQRRKRHRRMIYAIIALGFIASCLFTLLLNVSEAYTFLSILKTHIGIVFNAAMLMALIPGTISVSKMIKNYDISKKTKETK